jgi:hypothetical protein
MSRKTCVRAILTAALIYATGCSTFDLKKGIPWGAGLNGEFTAPMKVMPVWTDTVMYQSGKAPIRGFGGRMFFHKDENGDPVKVKGTLEVYAFDEAGRAPNDSRPTRKYVFTPEQFQKHYSKSEIGHSYSVFIPWDEHGGEQKHLTLIARFVPDGSPLVLSEPSRQSLPGKPPAQLAQQPIIPALPFGQALNGAQQEGYAPQAVAQIGQAGNQAPNQPFPVQQAAHHAPSPQPTPAEGSPHALQMTTTTIPVRGQVLGSMPHSSSILPAVAAARDAQAGLAPAPNGSAIGFGQVQQVQGTNPPTLAPSHVARSGLARHQALGAPLAPLPRDRALLQRPHVGWPSAPAGSPVPGPAPQSGFPSAAPSPAR